jgi:hypothetical protein
MGRKTTHHQNAAPYVALTPGTSFELEWRRPKMVLCTMTRTGFLHKSTTSMRRKSQFGRQREKRRAGRTYHSEEGPDGDEGDEEEPEAVAAQSEEESEEGRSCSPFSPGVSLIPPLPTSTEGMTHR